MININIKVENDNLYSSIDDIDRLINVVNKTNGIYIIDGDIDIITLKGRYSTTIKLIRK